MNSNQHRGGKLALLARVRQAQTQTRLPAFKIDEVPGPLSDKKDFSACAQRFQEELERLGVAYYVESSAARVRKRLKWLIEKKTVLSWHPDHLPFEAGEVLEAASREYSDSDSADTKAKAEIGLTGCDAAIAETGSLVLISGPGKARTASLLPYTHVAVVRPGDLVYSMYECFSSHAMELARASAVHIITGPSRTADIELSLTLGVHGPGEVIVVMGP